MHTYKAAKDSTKNVDKLSFDVQNNFDRRLAGETDLVEFVKSRSLLELLFSPTVKRSVQERFSAGKLALREDNFFLILILFQL